MPTAATPAAAPPARGRSTAGGRGEAGGKSVPPAFDDGDAPPDSGTKLAPAGALPIAPANTVLSGPAGPTGPPPALAGARDAATSADLRQTLFPPLDGDGAVPPLKDCRLEHFLVEERIGHGGMGAVFRAVDERLQRVVALKVLSPAGGRDRASVLRFRNEARSAARLDHENVARVFYVGEDRGMHFIAFEFVTGKTVRDLLAAGGPLDPREATSIARQVAAALEHCESAGVVHRDVKPSNIIVTPDGRVKLVDLGLARKQAADSVGELTVSGTTLGTFDYIAPEQAKDPRAADVRSDIYSLGCTLFHMLVGRPPYPEGTVLQKLLDHQNRETPDPRAANPRVPARLAELCRRMMASDPRERPQTPTDLIVELDELPGARRAGVRRRRDRSAALAAGGTLSLCALLAVFVWTRWPEPRPAEPEPPVVADSDPADVPVPAPLPASLGEPAPAVVTAPVAGEVAAEDAAADDAAPAADAAVARANTAAAVAPAPPARQPTFQVVAPDGADPRPADTFAAAVREASTGEIVVVNRDGPVETLTEPVQLTGKSLTVRAGRKPDGTLYRPELRAIPTYETPQALFYLAGRATLGLVGVDVVFQPTSNQTGWAAFSVGGEDSVRLEDCTVTLALKGDEAFAQATTLFNVRPLLRIQNASDLANPDARDSVDPGPFEITATRCLLRGRSNLATVGPDRSGSLTLTDTAVAVEAAALRLRGADPRGFPESGGGGVVRVALDHATLLVGSAFADVRWNSIEGERPPLPVRVLATHSLFVDGEEAVLVRTRGGADPVTTLARLDWTGRENQFAVRDFWTATGDTEAVVDPAPDFEAWRDLAASEVAAVSEVDSGSGNAGLEGGYKMRFPAQVVAGDFLPLPVGEVPPETLATADGEVVGADVADLPRAPPVR